MKHRGDRTFCALSLALVMAATTGAALRAQRRPDAQQPTINASATAIMVDVVVRDKKGHPVTDLEPTDFDLTEDGVAQDVTSFERVSRGIGFAIVRQEGAGPQPRFSPPQTVVDPRSGTGVLALVFDRLSPEARALAQKAAAKYVKENVLQGDRVGVYSIDVELRPIQPYTNDASAVASALNRWASMATAPPGSTADRLKDARDRQASSQGGVRAGEVAAAGISQLNPAQAREVEATMAGANVEQLYADMEMRMLKTFSTLERDQLGYATTNGLLAVINSLKILTGRKTIVFFSEGMSIPPAVQHHFRYVIDSANLANVSIYTMDASGLRIESNLEETRREVNAAGSQRLEQVASGIDVSDSLMKVMEHNETMLNIDPHAGLGQLATETGGFLIRNTNDLQGGFRRIDDDMRFHYVLTYAPKNQNFNGGFRRIGVKVRRPDVEIRARKGYYAIRESGPSPVLSYEAAAVAVLDSPTTPNTFPVRASALQFPQPARPGLATILVEVPMDQITFQTDAEKQRYATDFTVLVRIKDANNQISHKMSQQYELGGPTEQLALAKRGEVIFYRAPDLEPGVYTMETAVFDALSGKASVRISTIDMPKHAGRGPQVSSLMIVKRSEKVPEKERDAANPLYYGDLLLYPNLGQSLKRALDKQLAFYAAVYPTSKDAVPQASIELFKDGQPAGHVALELANPDASGRIQHVGRVPIETFPAGTYELRLTVKDAGGEQVRSASFRVE
jgi:VWFA-related protein